MAALLSDSNLQAASPPLATAEVDVDAALAPLVQALAVTAVERDRQGGHAAAERQLIRDSGLLTLLVPRSHGGAGAPSPTVFRTIRRLAEVDSALAHVYGFHHLQVAGVFLYGNAEQQQRLLRQTVDEALFWGNALNPLDPRLVATKVEGGWSLTGIKNYASGSVGSDRLTLSAHVPVAGGGPAQLMIASLPTRSAGIVVAEDWDSFGQRQTDSGTVRFEQVFLPQADVLQAPGITPTVRTTLRSQFAQLVMANLYLGIANGAFEAARRFTVDEGKPWVYAGVPRAQDDPYVQHRYGQLRLLLRPAQLLTDAAADELQAALARGDAVTAQQRGEVAVTIAEAKAVSHRAAMEISSQLFELTGARSTSARYGFDRFWRNARVHTLHDPVDYKLRDIGRYALSGQWPEPTPYS